MWNWQGVIWKWWIQHLSFCCSTLGRVSWPVHRHTGWLQMHYSPKSWTSSSAGYFWGFLSFLRSLRIHVCLFTQHLCFFFSIIILFACSPPTKQPTKQKKPHVNEKLNWCILWLINYIRYVWQNHSDFTFFQDLSFRKIQPRVPS